jgi:hypothetical protein
MVVHIERTAYGPFSYRLTTQALVVRAVLVGTLAAVALSGECVSRFRWMHRSVAARGTAAGEVRDRMSPVSDSR